MRDNGAGVLALSDIDFEVNENEFVTIIGPSGCGKTTLLRIIAGLIPYDQGEVAIDGRRLPDPDRNARWCFRTSRYCRGLTCLPT